MVYNQDLESNVEKGKIFILYKLIKMAQSFESKYKQKFLERRWRMDFISTS